MGAPWGLYTQGGIHVGVLPVRGKIVGAISICVLVFLAIAMLSAAQIVVHVPRWMSWVALGIQGLSMLLNWITPSRVERLVWGPITTAMFAMALMVMFL